MIQTSSLYKKKFAKFSLAISPQLLKIWFLERNDIGKYFTLSKKIIIPSINATQCNVAKIYYYTHTILWNACNNVIDASKKAFTKIQLHAHKTVKFVYNLSTRYSGHCPTFVSVARCKMKRRSSNRISSRSAYV